MIISPFTSVAWLGLADACLRFNMITFFPFPFHVDFGECKWNDNESIVDIWCVCLCVCVDRRVSNVVAHIHPLNIHFRIMCCPAEWSERIVLIDPRPERYYHFCCGTIESTPHNAYRTHSPCQINKLMVDTICIHDYAIEYRCAMPNEFNKTKMKEEDEERKTTRKCLLPHERTQWVP